MKLEEIRKEIEADERAILHKLLGMTDKTIKVMRKTKMTHLHKSFDYISPRKNNWIIGYTFNSAHKENCRCHYVAIMYRPGGFTVIYPPPDDKLIRLFTDHFFKRYNERLNLNLVDPKDKIRHFLLNIGNAPYEKIEDIKPGAFSFFAQTKLGVMLGVQYADVRIAKFNTFLSPDMLKGDQVALAEKLKLELDKYKNQEII